MSEDERAQEEAASDAHAESRASTRGLTPAMRTTLIVAAVLLVAALVLWFTLPSSPGQSALPGAGPTTSATPQTPDSIATTPGPLPGATPTTGSEVEPPSPTPAADSGLPPLPAQTPLVADPLPRSASATSELVDGLPIPVMGPASDSDVISSSIATEGQTMQVTLIARTDAPADDVRAHYRDQWTKLGLAASGAEGADVASSDSFTSLSLAFSSTSGTGTLYTVYGVFRTS